MADARIELLVVSDAILDAMSRNPDFRANFAACLAPLDPADAGCRRCGRAPRRTGAPAYQQVRNCIDALPDAKKVQLRSLLGAKKLRLDVQRGQSMVQLTF